MKTIATKIAAAIAAATLCTVPMMNTINANAEFVITYTLEGDINEDGKYDFWDTAAFTRYVNGNSKDKMIVEEMFPQAAWHIKDWNHNGKIDEDDGYMIDYLAVTYPKYSYQDMYNILHCERSINVKGVDRSAYCWGDANGDLMFSIGDIMTMSDYFKDPKHHPAAQLMYNRSCSFIVDHPDGKIVKEDYTFHMDRLISRLGDANGDGQVDICDKVAIEQYVADRDKYPLAGKFVETADMDGDGCINDWDIKPWEQIIQKNLFYQSPDGNNYKYNEKVMDSLISYYDLYK